MKPFGKANTTRIARAIPGSVKVGRGTMSMSDEFANCLFCQVGNSVADDLEWHDRPLVRVRGVGAVIPGLGAFVPGYVLVFPEQHVKSTLRVTGNAGMALNDLLCHTIRAVTEVFGPVTVFEHGSCAQRGIRRSACLDHAHTHILPGIYGLSSAMPKPNDPLMSRLGRTFSVDVGYLLLNEPPHGPRYGPDPGISQYLRRCIAAKLGIPDEWDYLLFPRLGNVRETVRTLSGRIASAPIADHSIVT